MSVEMRLSLDQDTLSLLQNLVGVNLDSRDGFREAASNIQDHGLVELLQDIARQREVQAAELSALVTASGEHPANTGSAMAAAHRVWMDLRAALGGGVKAVLREARRGEDYLLAQYESALRDCDNQMVMELLERHHAAIKATRDAIRLMHDDEMV